VSIAGAFRKLTACRRSSLTLLWPRFAERSRRGVDSRWALVVTFGAMEFAEALLALGVGGASEWETLSAEGLKRAYLKKVRAHPPERDPQGFQRVRKAYELLQGLEPVRAASRGSAPVSPSTAIRAESVTPTPEREAGDEERVARAPALGSSAFDRLQQALTEQQYDTAADALIEIYASATLASPRPAPHLVLSVITKQFMLGAQDRGRRLFLSFEGDMAHMNGPLGARQAASWKLLAELIALSAQLPPAVIGALAGAIESGNFQQANETLRAELDERGSQRRLNLELSLQTSAPTLYEAAWPRTRGVSRKQQRSEQRWARGMLFSMLVLGSSFMYFVDRAPSRRADQTAAARASDVARSSEHDSTAHATNAAILGALSAEQAKDLDSVTSKVEKVVRFSRCHQLRAVWADYTGVVRRLKGYESVMREYEAHRVDAGTTCPQLASELPVSL